MNRYSLVSNTGKRLTMLGKNNNFNTTDRIQKKLTIRGIKTTMQIARGKA